MFLKHIPMFGYAYILFLFANLFGFTNYLFKSSIFEWTLAGGNTHNPTWSYVIIFIGVVMSYIEILRSTNANDKVILDHVLSTAALLAFIITYVTAKWAGNSVFLTFTFFALLDVVAGFTISISVARRDFSIH